MTLLRRSPVTIPSCQPEQLTHVSLCWWPLHPCLITPNTANHRAATTAGSGVQVYEIVDVLNSISSPGLLRFVNGSAMGHMLSRVASSVTSYRSSCILSSTTLNFRPTFFWTQSRVRTNPRFRQTRPSSPSRHWFNIPSCFNSATLYSVTSHVVSTFLFFSVSGLTDCIVAGWHCSGHIACELNVFICLFGPPVCRTMSRFNSIDRITL